MARKKKRRRTSSESADGDADVELRERAAERRALTPHAPPALSLGTRNFDGVEIMALAKKHSRPIVVDGSTYRWTIDADDEPGLGIVVELAEGLAQRCVTWVSHGNIVTPAVVRHCIVSALEQGWTPDRRGPELRFRIAGALTSRPVPF